MTAQSSYAEAMARRGEIVRRALGIDYFQGFLFHRPTPATSIKEKR